MNKTMIYIPQGKTAYEIAKSTISEHSQEHDKLLIVINDAHRLITLGLGYFILRHMGIVYKNNTVWCDGVSKEIELNRDTYFKYWNQ